MKFLCKTHELLQALQMTGRGIGGQQTLPILGNILIVAEGKRCTFSATNLELSIVTSFPAQIENEGAVTVPAKAILNFAQYNPDEEVLLETSDGSQLKCSSKHTKTTIAGESASEYPTITPIEKQTTFTLESKPLLEALHFVTFAAAKTTLRPVLSGVYVRSEKDQLILVSTDSYRLSEYKLATAATGSDISCIIPSKVLEELKMILGGSKGSDEAEEGEKDKKKTAPLVTVSLSSQQVEFQVGQTHLLSRLIDGKFPDYKQILPKDQRSVVVFSVKDLITTVRRMHYFAKETNNNLTFTLSNGTAKIITPQTQYGRDEAMLQVGISGEENKIALSSSYLLDFLGHINEEQIQMELTDHMHPAVFRLLGTPQFLHLIMPLRMQEG